MESTIKFNEIKIPTRIYLSKSVTDKLRNLKRVTKLNSNVLCRIAIMIALKEKALTLANVEVGDTSGQEFSRDLLFGEHLDIYEMLIRQYMFDNDVDLSFTATIASLVEIGVQKFSYVKSLEQLCDLT